MPHTVDKEGRCAVDAAAYATHKIAAHFVSVLASVGPSQEHPVGLFGKPERCADQENRRDVQPALVFVHFPKQARCAAELGAFGGDLGVRVYLGQGKKLRKTNRMRP